MKTTKKTLLLITIILLTSNVMAAMPPWPAYCEHQGYTYEYNITQARVEKTHGYCIFDDGNKCEAKDFLEGECGQAYIKEIPCRKDGELVFSQFEECCQGLTEFSAWLGQAKCLKDLTFKQKFAMFWQKLSKWFHSFFE